MNTTTNYTTQDTTTTTRTTMNTTTTDGLQNSALLVTLSMGIPDLVKTDKKATQQVEATNRTAQNIGEFKKKLLTADTLDSINTLRGAARTYHYAKTLPWGDSGIRLLPNVYLLDYQNTMRVFAVEFDRLRNLFLQAYPAEVAQAQLKLVGLFNEAEYPSVRDLERKFKFSVAFEPLPLVGDFRVDVGNAAAQELKEQYTKITNERIAEAMGEVWGKLLKPLKNMSERLDYDDEGKPRNGHFKGTIVTNVLEIVEAMKACNLTGDSRMEQVRIDLRRALEGVTYDRLKSSETLRVVTKEKIDTIISTLPSLGW